MESRGRIMKNSKKVMKSQMKTQMKIIIALIIFLTISGFLLLDDASHSRKHSLATFINKACSKTLHSSLCRSTLSTILANSTTAIFPEALLFAVNQTRERVRDARFIVRDHFTDQELDPPEENALLDCLELFDQSLYELDTAMNELASSPSSVPLLHRSYANINTLLSAAMTNQYTCIEGFLYLERKSVANTRLEQNLLTPIAHMISNSLALINQETVKNSAKKMELVEEAVDYVIMARRRRNAARNSRPNAIVACDGTGDYAIIGEAVAAAPNMSRKTYTIKVKAGVYKENVVIPREKTNIMLVGDGMSSTIITGSRNLVDGFSTFVSATLTVLGDKFMAMDITIENTAAPEKHQAVALMVTSNAAFYRCGIISHQDTLYAHSLRQLYQECTIQGTIDFIFGNAAAVFQNCTILVRRPIRGQRNTITAQGREDPHQNTGFSLQSCTIKAAADFSPAERKHFSTYLGRPWRNYSRVIIANSYLDDLVHPRGWLEWAEYSSVETVEYIECMNSGPGAFTRRRVSWGGYRKNCSQKSVKQFGVEEFLHGADNWLESTVIPIFGAS